MNEMRIRSKLFMLTASELILPFIVAGLWFAVAGFGKSQTFNPRLLMAADSWLEHLSESTNSLDDFLATVSKSDPRFTLVVVGKEGQILYPVGQAQYSWVDSHGNVSYSGMSPTEMLWDKPFEVKGSGRVRVLLKVDLSWPKPRVNPFPIIGIAILFLFLVLGDVWIARSLSKSFSSLEASADRLREGDFDSPVMSPRDPDAARLASTLESLRVSLNEEKAKRSRLLMGVSHDFRTPIALIRGYAESLLNGVARTPEAERRYLGIIRDKTDQLNSLVEDLLDYVRTETDQRRAVKEIADIRAFFVSLAAEFAEDASLGERRFAFRDSIGRPVPAPLDSRLTRRAFENLFSNAMRYTEPGGSIEMDIELIDGEKLVATLSDDGIGIRQADIPTIFEPLYRGRNVGKRAGSGLGLSIVKSVIEGQGWSIACSSIPDQGTRFSVIVPLSGIALDSGQSISSQ